MDVSVGRTCAISGFAKYSPALIVKYNQDTAESQAFCLYLRRSSVLGMAMGWKSVKSQGLDSTWT